LGESPEISQFRSGPFHPLRSSSRSCLRRSHTSETLTTSSSASTASRLPSPMRRLQLKSRLGATPCIWATCETYMPDRLDSSTSRIFCSIVKRRPRCTLVITPFFSFALVINLGVCLGHQAMPRVPSKRGLIQVQTPSASSSCRIRSVKRTTGPQQRRNPAAPLAFLYLMRINYLDAAQRDQS